MKKLFIVLFILLLATNVYAQDWSLLDEPFDDLDDWTNADDGGGVSEISPAGYLHQTAGAPGTAGINQDIGTIGTGDYTVEFKLKLDSHGNINKYIAIHAGTNRLHMYIPSTNELKVFDGVAWQTLITQDFTDDYHIIRLVVHNSQTDVDTYLDGVLQNSDVDCSYATATDGFCSFSLGNDGDEWHFDYIKIDDGQHVPIVAAGQVMTTIIY